MSDEEYFDREIAQEARREYEVAWCALADYYLSRGPAYDAREDDDVYT